jgi:hypothetical protein
LIELIVCATHTQQAAVVGGSSIGLQQYEFTQLFTLHQQLSAHANSYDVNYLSANLLPVDQLKHVLSGCQDDAIKVYECIV